MRRTTSKYLNFLLFSFLFPGLGCGDSTATDNRNNIRTTGTTRTNNRTSTTGISSGTTSGESPEFSNLPTLNFVAVKHFRFGWTDVADATYYQILENPDGKSDFSKVGDDIAAGIRTTDIEVALHLRTNALYKLRSCNDAGCTDSESVAVSGNLVDAIGYFKAVNAGVRDAFGSSIAMSADGQILAVGAPKESSRDANDETDDAWVDAGAVYIFTQSNGKWTQQAYLKASNADRNDRFGHAISMNAAGDALAVGAPSEDGRFADDPSDNSRPDSGAAYVFERQGTTWSQTHYLKLNKTIQGNQFGHQLHISDDGLSILAKESRGPEVVSVNHLTKMNDEWILQPGFSKPDGWEINFGIDTAMSASGRVVAVGANYESSDASGVDGDPDNTNLSRSGAVFVYELVNDVWEETYIKADIPIAQAEFGIKTRLSGDGKMLAVSGRGKKVASDTETFGFLYLYKKNNETWEFTEKFSTNQYYGFTDINLNQDGTLVAMSVTGDESPSAGLNGDRTAGAPGSSYGAVYVHALNGTQWEEVAYVKASNPGPKDGFGANILIGDNGTLVVGVSEEGSSATGVDGDQDNDDAEFSGAVYLY